MGAGAVKSAINRGARVVPADKGEVQDLKAEIAEYKTETSAVIDQLVGEVNSLTPVGSSLQARLLVWRRVQTCCPAVMAISDAFVTHGTEPSKVCL